LISFQGSKGENENDAEENGNLTQGDKLNQVKLAKKKLGTFFVTVISVNMYLHFYFTFVDNQSFEISPISI